MVHILGTTHACFMPTNVFWKDMLVRRACWLCKLLIPQPSEPIYYILVDNEEWPVSNRPSRRLATSRNTSGSRRLRATTRVCAASLTYYALGLKNSTVSGDSSPFFSTTSPPLGPLSLRYRPRFSCLWTRDLLLAKLLLLLASATGATIIEYVRNDCHWRYRSIPYANRWKACTTQ